jgi:uncharacterized repeat protein (TIGR01451 family)
VRQPGSGRPLAARRLAQGALLPLAAAAAAFALPAVASAATVSGTAFEDFNDNGVRNTAPMVDSGVGGIRVTAYGAGGAVLASGTTAADGGYSLNVPDPAGRVRIEFTDLPAGYQPARHGTNSGTTVQFADLSGGNVSGLDVGVLQPANYCQDNPDLAVPCFQFGDHTGTFANRAAIRLVSDGTPDNTTPNPAGVGVQNPAATFAQVGSVFGVAQPKGTNSLFSAAYTKRHSDWGPAGPGAVYRTDIAQAHAGTPNASLFFDVNSLPGNPAGSPTRATGGWENDAGAWNAVGNTGLGNLSTNLDGSALYTVGLATGQLIQIPVPADGSSPAPGAVNAYTVPSPCTPTGDGRPMSTAVHNGLVYVGGVCSMASVGDPPATGKLGDGRMRLYVYTFDPATGTFSSGPVLDQVLESNRLCVTRNTTTFPDPLCGVAGAASADWHPWTSQSTGSIDPLNPWGNYPQPMLSDIAFVGDDMVLGIRDRSSDQLGSASFFPDGSAGEAGVQSGYNLRACVSGGAYQLENNGTCGGLTSGAQNIAQFGPGNGLFYWEQGYNTQPGAAPGSHDYTGLGAVLQIPGYADLRTTAMDAANRCPAGMSTNNCQTAGYNGPNASAGLLYLSNRDGSRAKGWNLYTADGSTSPPSTFSKANGLGDLEALCDAAPIEIGNYVWLDANRDGVQDPDEPAIAGVDVELLDGSGTVVGRATTDANGQYYFNETNVTGGIQPHTDYTVRIPLGQAVLDGFTPTTDHASADLRDSNGVVAGAYVIDRLRTDAAGHNDHTHDFGFFWFNVSIRKTVSSPTAKIGDAITYTLTARNDGPSWATDVVVTDDLPDRLQLVGARTSQGSCTTAGNGLRCELGTLRPGQVETVTVTARAIASGTAVNTAEIRSPGDRDPRDNRDDERVEIPTPDVSIVKTVSAGRVKLGESVTYTLTARNNGPGNADEVIVTDALPSRLKLTSVRSEVGSCTTSGNSLRCALGTMTEGQEVRITVGAKAVKTGRAVNNAVIGAREDSNPDNNRDRVPVVITRVDLALTKTVNRKVLQAGQTATFTIKTRNPTSVTLRNVRTCDALPAGLAFVKATPKAKVVKGQYCWTAKALKPGQTVTYKITVRALNGAAGRRINRAVATAPDADTRRANRPVRIIAGGVSPAGGVTG